MTLTKRLNIVILAVVILAVTVTISVIKPTLATADDGGSDSSQNEELDADSLISQMRSRNKQISRLDQSVKDLPTNSDGTISSDSVLGLANQTKSTLSDIGLLDTICPDDGVDHTEDDCIPNVNDKVDEDLTSDEEWVSYVQHIRTAGIKARKYFYGLSGLTKTTPESSSQIKSDLDDLKKIQQPDIDSLNKKMNSEIKSETNNAQPAIDSIKNFMNRANTSPYTSTYPSTQQEKDYAFLYSFDDVTFDGCFYKVHNTYYTNEECTFKNRDIADGVIDVINGVLKVRTDAIKSRYQPEIDGLNGDLTNAEEDFNSALPEEKIELSDDVSRDPALVQSAKTKLETIAKDTLTILKTARRAKANTFIQLDKINDKDIDTVGEYLGSGMKGAIQSAKHQAKVLSESDHAVDPNLDNSKFPVSAHINGYQFSNIIVGQFGGYVAHVKIEYQNPVDGTDTEDSIIQYQSSQTWTSEALLFGQTKNIELKDIDDHKMKKHAKFKLRIEVEGGPDRKEDDYMEFNSDISFGTGFYSQGTTDTNKALGELPYGDPDFVLKVADILSQKAKNKFWSGFAIGAGAVIAAIASLGIGLVVSYGTVGGEALAQGGVALFSSTQKFVINLTMGIFTGVLILGATILRQFLLQNPDDLYQYEINLDKQNSEADLANKDESGKFKISGFAYVNSGGFYSKPVLRWNKKNDNKTYCAYVGGRTSGPNNENGLRLGLASTNKLYSLNKHIPTAEGIIENDADNVKCNTKKKPENDVKLEQGDTMQLMAEVQSGYSRKTSDVFVFSTDSTYKAGYVAQGTTLSEKVLHLIAFGASDKVLEKFGVFVKSDQSEFNSLIFNVLLTVAIIVFLALVEGFMAYKAFMRSEYMRLVTEDIKRSMNITLENEGILSEISENLTLSRSARLNSDGISSRLPEFGVGEVPITEVLESIEDSRVCFAQNSKFFQMVAEASMNSGFRNESQYFASFIYKIDYILQKISNFRAGLGIGMANTASFKSLLLEINQAFDAFFLEGLESLKYYVRQLIEVTAFDIFNFNSEFLSYLRHFTIFQTIQFTTEFIKDAVAFAVPLSINSNKYSFLKSGDKAYDDWIKSLDVEDSNEEGSTENILASIPSIPTGPSSNKVDLYKSLANLKQFSENTTDPKQKETLQIAMNNAVVALRDMLDSNDNDSTTTTDASDNGFSQTSAYNEIDNYTLGTQSKAPDDFKVSATKTVEENDNALLVINPNGDTYYEGLQTTVKAYYCSKDGFIDGKCMDTNDNTGVVSITSDSDEVSTTTNYSDHTEVKINYKGLRVDRNLLNIQSNKPGIVYYVVSTPGFPEHTLFTTVVSKGTPISRIDYKNEVLTGLDPNSTYYFVDESGIKTNFTPSQRDYDLKCLTDDEFIAGSVCIGEELLGHSGKLFNDEFNDEQHTQLITFPSRLGAPDVTFSPTTSYVKVDGLDSTQEYASSKDGFKTWKNVNPYDDLWTDIFGQDDTHYIFRLKATRTNFASQSTKELVPTILNDDVDESYDADDSLAIPNVIFNPPVVAGGIITVTNLTDDLEYVTSDNPTIWFHVHTTDPMWSNIDSKSNIGYKFRTRGKENGLPSKPTYWLYPTPIALDYVNEAFLGLAPGQEYNLIDESNQLIISTITASIDDNLKCSTDIKLSAGSACIPSDVAFVRSVRLVSLADTNREDEISITVRPNVPDVAFTNDFANKKIVANNLSKDLEYSTSESNFTSFIDVDPNSEVWENLLMSNLKFKFRVKATDHNFVSPITDAIFPNLTVSEAITIGNPKLVTACGLNWRIVGVDDKSNNDIAGIGQLADGFVALLLDSSSYDANQIGSYSELNDKISGLVCSELPSTTASDIRLLDDKEAKALSDSIRVYPTEYWTNTDAKFGHSDEGTTITTAYGTVMPDGTHSYLYIADSKAAFRPLVIVKRSIIDDILLGQQ